MYKQIISAKGIWHDIHIISGSKKIESNNKTENIFFDFNKIFRTTVIFRKKCSVQRRDTLFYIPLCCVNKAKEELFILHPIRKEYDGCIIYLACCKNIEVTNAKVFKRSNEGGYWSDMLKGNVEEEGLVWSI